MIPKAPPSRPPPPGAWRNQCVAEHRTIEGSVALAREALARGDVARHASQWAHFVQTLSHHMEVEEHLMLPRLVGTASRLARTLVAEHNHLRARMAELAQPSPCAAERLDQLDRFIEELRGHARHEEAAIYPWAEEHPDPALK